MSDTRREPRVRCTIYKGRRKPDVYLYLRQGQDLEGLPEALLQALGPLEEVMRLELHPGRRLAQADVAQVMRQLEAQGFYLQLPPEKAFL